ncbi:COP1-interacting protein 7-like [Nicotiana tabacum]|uniref:COP1-interacting protein 7-like n=1 Tax=Nicotiana tabacum TaxID=4097 RepID=A0A1S4CSJ5_TOBAC
MKSSARLDSVVFQLTPTRTRCDLFIIANGKKEKLASGLLNPFLAHLRTAQDQIAKGGYSVLLEPDAHVDASWFTKGTVERFVRFVSTPEILERVYTIESEILQIEEAIALQGHNDIGIGPVEHKEAKPAGNFAGTKSTAYVSEEKAIVLYKPGENQPQTNGSGCQEENSRVQLLKVLETRKSVLQKEQGMAFARAVAAGFDIDRMAQMVSFAESFGASRLKDACVRFMELWKKKHENGQWVEIEAAEAMANQLNIAAMNASGILLSNIANKQFDSNAEMASENYVKSSADSNSGERPPFDQQNPNGQQQYQFLHPMFPPWTMHSPGSAVPAFQGYPMQGVPYYPAYPGNGPLYQPPYPGMEDSQMSVTPKTRQKRQSLDRGESNSESEEDEEMDSEGSHSQRKKAGGRSRKKQSGKVVIRNINYITSKTKNSSDSESEAASGSEKDADSEDLEGNGHNSVNRETSWSSKTRRSRTKFQDESILYDDDAVREKEADGGHWLAFQNCLLKGNEEESQADKNGMFSMEKDARRRRKNTTGDDPLASGAQDGIEMKDRLSDDIHTVGAKMSRMSRGPNGELLLSNRGYDSAQGLGDKMDMQFTEINGRKVMLRTSNDDFMLNGRDNQSGMRNSLDPLAVNAFEHANKIDRASSHDMADESFIVPFRSMSLDDVGPDGRTAINMDSELPHQKSENNSVGVMSYYEPNDLSLMPERGTEKRSGVYDPALDYEMQFCIEGSASKDKRKNGVSNDVNVGSKKSEKDRRSKATADTSDKKRSGGPIRKGKMSKSSPLDDARARADRIRSFKSDIQKMKKEKEEADQKRIEALKLERQKRIASRGGSSSARSPAPTAQTRKLPAKLSPSTIRGSKFSDSEPGSSSPLQRTKIRTSLVSSDLQKGSKASKSTDGSKLAGNKLSRSASSLSEPKKENNGVTPNSKASMARIRRLSEPKAISGKPGTLGKAQSAEFVSKPKARSAEPVSKTKRSDVPESKKISAIIDLDKKKAATLPELKIRTTKESSDLPQDKPAAENIAKEKNDRPSVVSKDVESYKSDPDENIIEKTVVMLEKEKPSFAASKSSSEKDSVEKTDYASTRDPPSPFEGFIRAPAPSQLQKLSNTHEVGTSYADDTPKFANIGSTVYRAPYARVSSVEDPSTRNLEYVKAPPSSSDIASTVKEIAKAHAPDIHTIRVDNNPEAAEKTQLKESPKGFKRLLRFGKKNHSSAGAESDGATMNSVKQDDSAANASLPSEVYTLKNLISQDETPTGGNAPQKSRLSLLSPFRSKTSEKR